MEVAGFILSIIAIVLGIGGLLMAIPPFLQMFYGRFELSAIFADSTELQGRLLLCHIKNKPIENRFLRWIGVKRDVVEVFARFEIRRHGTNEIIASNFRPMIGDVISHTLALSSPVKPPLGVTFSVVEHSNAGARSLSEAPGAMESVTLSPGEYYTEIHIGAGDDFKVARKSFTIAAVKEGTFWTSREALPCS